VILSITNSWNSHVPINNLAFKTYYAVPSFQGMAEIISRMIAVRVNRKKKLTIKGHVRVKVNDGVCPFLHARNIKLLLTLFEQIELLCYGLAKEYDFHYSLIFGCGIGFFWQGGSSK
ncbi:hypothetical protein ACJX0J_015653, partial [Zea mays]